MASAFYRELTSNLDRIATTFLPFKERSQGNYTARQLTMAAAYTVFAHAEFEAFLESWASAIVDFAYREWKSGRPTRPLVHLCTFHEGRNAPSSVPSKDIWNEVVYKAILKHRAIINSNNGIKESNFCELMSPIGLDTTHIDPILLADLTAFGSLRGQYAHNSYQTTIGTTFDPFDRKNKVRGIHSMIKDLDDQLCTFLTTP